LESRIRTAEPPRLTRTGWRTEWLSKPPDQFGVPKKSGNAAIIELDQVPVQWPAGWPERAAAGPAVIEIVTSDVTSAAHAARRTIESLINPSLSNASMHPNG
jgi:hypothetical protein